MASSDKYTKAVDRAAGNGMTVKEGGALNTAPQNIESMIKKGVTKEELNSHLNREDLEFAPQLFKLEQDDMIEGVLEGNGPEAEFERHDKVTGVVEVTRVQTWIIATPDGGRRLSILSSVQLDRKLPPFVGGMVSIYRGKDINTANGNRVTDYLVGAPKLSGGARRSWATKPVIDAVSSPAQLTSGSSDPDAAASNPAAS